MTALLATPTPYLRDGLRRLVAGLRKDAETVRLNLAEAEQDVAAARALLAEAEAQHQRAKDAADALDREIAFFEREAERTPPAYDPDAALAATGLMHEPPVPAAELPGMWEEADFQGGATDMDDLVPPGAPVTDSRAEVAPHLPVAPPVPHGPAGRPVATSGPLMTMPDLAPQRVQLDPPPGEGTRTHAKDRPGLLARLTGGHRTIRDEQDGDADE